MDKNERHQTQTQNQQLFQLQSQLLQAWTQVRVQEYYQHLVLNYLDTLPLRQAQQLIQRQIRLIKEGKSLYFQLVGSQNARKKSLRKLETLIGEQQHNHHRHSQALPQICEQLKSLRDNGLTFAETLVKIIPDLTSGEGVISDECRQMLQNLENDNRFLKESFLKDFIMFSQEYDPFFMHHYDAKATKAPRSASRSIEQLFTLSLNYACRLFKVNAQIINAMAASNPVTLGPVSIQSEKKRKRRFSKAREDAVRAESESKEYRNSRSSFYIRQHSVKQKSKEEQYNSYNTISVDVPSQARRPALKIKKRQKGQFPSLPHIQIPKHETIGHPDPQCSRVPLQEQSNQSQPYKISVKEPIKDDDYQINQTPEEVESPLRSKKSSHNHRSLHPIFKRKHAKKDLQSQESQSIKAIDFSFNGVPPGTSDESQTEENAINDSADGSVPYFPYARQLSEKNEKQTKLQDAIHKAGHRSVTSSQTEPSSPVKVGQKSIESILINMTPQQDISDSRATLIPKNILKTKIQKTEKAKMNLDFDLPSIKDPIKMKPRKHKYQQLIELVRSTPFQQKIKDLVSSPNWEESLKKFQTYVTSFTIQDQLVLLSISLLLPDGNYLLKLWGQTEKCPQHLSLSLFKRYINYLEDNTSLDKIFYNGPPTKQVIETGFVEMKTNSFRRDRKKQKKQKKHEFGQYLTMRCTNITFPQQQITKNMLSSQDIEQFDLNNSFCLQSLATVDRKQVNQGLQMLIKVSEDINSMETLNSLLEDEDLGSFYASKGMDIADIKALRLRLNAPFKYPFVTTKDGYLKFQGSLLHKTESQTICLIACSVYNTKILFGKGFLSTKDFTSSIQKQNPESCEFSVKTFSKQLYGRLATSSQSEVSYGCWQINLDYSHELQGHTRHSHSHSIQFGSQSFQVAIEVEGQVVYAFRVTSEDHLL